MQTKRSRRVRAWTALTALLATAFVASIAAVGASAQTGPPKNAGHPTITGAAVVGKALTAHNGSWAGAQPITYAYQWQRCSSTGTGCTNISEAAQSQAYVLTSDDLGKRLKVDVTATNSAGSGSAESPTSAVVRAAPMNAPVNTSAPSISGSLIQGNTLTVSNGSWNGATPLTYAYQWQRCDTSGADCRNITDATSQTYSTVGLDVGNTLRAVVTATNSDGSASSVSHQSGTVRSASSVQASLSASSKLVTYGTRVTLSGTISGASAGDVVTILARPGLNRLLQSVASTTTDGNGSFTKTVVPRMHTVYAARGDGAQSDSLAINVRPGLQLFHVTHGRLAVRVTAAKSLVGRYVNIQAFVHHRWTTVKHVFLTHRSFGISPTIFSSATFRPAMRHGLRIRAFMTLSQAGPNYVSAMSRLIRS